MIFLMFLWYAVMAVQVFLSYGTAYRLTKSGGDNGVSLFISIWLLSMASIIPGLGIFLWYKYREESVVEANEDANWNARLVNERDVLKKQLQEIQVNIRACPACNTEITTDSIFCKSCGINVIKHDEQKMDTKRKEFEERGLRGIIDALLEDEEFVRSAKYVKRAYGKSALVGMFKRKAKELGYGEIDITDDDVELL